MLDRDIGLARPEFLRMPLIYQPRAKLGLSARARSTNAIIAPMSSPKYGQHKGGVGEDARIVSWSPGGAAAQNRAPFPVISRDLRPTVRMEYPMVAHRRPGERRTVIGVARDCLFEQIQHLGKSALR